MPCTHICTPLHMGGGGPCGGAPFKCAPHLCDVPPLDGVSPSALAVFTSTTAFDFSTISSRLRELAFLNPQVHFLPWPAPLRALPLQDLSTGFGCPGLACHLCLAACALGLLPACSGDPEPLRGGSRGRRPLASWESRPRPGSGQRPGQRWPPSGVSLPGRPPGVCLLAHQ